MKQKRTNRQNSHARTGKTPLSKAQKQKRERNIMIIMIVTAVIMVIGAMLCILYNRWVKKPSLPISYVPPHDSQNIESEGMASEPPSINAVQPKVSGERKSADYYTILIFGEDMTSGLTDNIMLVSYDMTNQQATVISFPRDTLINSGAKSVTDKMINAVYSRNGGGDKGIEALKTEVSELMGFTPDFYVKINWELVGQIVDAIGGVWFEVPWHMGYDDPRQDLYIHFEEGYQYLSGEDAMKLVRWRKNNDGTSSPGGGSDLSRLNVQHDFLKSVLKQTLQIKNAFHISQLAELFNENVISDLTTENLFWFASQAIFGGLSVDDVIFVTMPYCGVSTGIYKYRLYPNESALLALINDSLNPFVAEVTISQLDLIAVSSDGNILSSSTGVLKDPSAGCMPVTATPKPTNNPEFFDNPEPFDNPETIDNDLPQLSDNPEFTEYEPSESELPESKNITDIIID